MYLHYVTRELVRLGHEVHVISGRPYPQLHAGVVHHRLHTYSFWAFLNGNESPTIETADADFSVLGIQMRGFHDFGVSLQDPRGGVKSNGQ